MLAPCLALLALAACDGAATTTGPGPASDIPILASNGVTASATGGGHVDLGVPVKFSFSAVQRDPSGEATGQLRFSTELGGLAIDFRGRVTCMTTDPENARAWIGGVVTRNDSEHPGFTGEIHDVGRDIWFRVVDYGQGGSAPQADRTTFVGFEGARGIITSEEYCAARLWLDDDVGTGPLTSGNIQVRS